MAGVEEKRRVASECRERAYRNEFTGEVIARTIGAFAPTGTTRYDHDAWYRLADLIEPDDVIDFIDERWEEFKRSHGPVLACGECRPEHMVDREALLALAEQLDSLGVGYALTRAGARDAARRIREACGREGA